MYVVQTQPECRITGCTLPCPPVFLVLQRTVVLHEWKGVFTGERETYPRLLGEEWWFLCICFQLTLIFLLYFVFSKSFVSKLIFSLRNQSVKLTLAYCNKTHSVFISAFISLFIDSFLVLSV